MADHLAQQQRQSLKPLILIRIFGKSGLQRPERRAHAPLLWCVGRDPADKNILVLKVSANRGWGFRVTPAVRPRWAYSSLGDELGLKDLLTAGLTGNVVPGFDAPDGSMWLAPGQSAHTKDSPKEIGKLAARAFRYAILAEYGLVLAEAVGDTTFGDVAFRLSVLTKPVPPPVDASCRQDIVSGALCTFVNAVQSGKTSKLTHTEQQVAKTIRSLPKGPYSVSSCVLEGDVTVRCEITFTSTLSGSGRTAAGFLVQPANGEYDDGRIILPPGEKLRYQVIQYLGLKAPPRVGDLGTVTVRDGLFTESFNGFVFCDSTQAQAGTCGA